MLQQWHFYENEMAVLHLKTNNKQRLRFSLLEEMFSVYFQLALVKVELNTAVPPEKNFP